MTIYEDVAHSMYPNKVEIIPLSTRTGVFLLRIKEIPNFAILLWSEAWRDATSKIFIKPAPEYEETSHRKYSVVCICCIPSLFTGKYATSLEEQNEIRNDFNTELFQELDKVCLAQGITTVFIRHKMNLCTEIVQFEDYSFLLSVLCKVCTGSRVFEAMKFVANQGCWRGNC